MSHDRLTLSVLAKLDWLGSSQVGGHGQVRADWGYWQDLYEVTVKI